MLVRLTLACHELCTHCMVDANPEGRHMTENTLGLLLEFCRRLAVNGLPHYSLIVSGGEITLHPHWMEFCQRIAESLPRWKIVLESNGSFVTDPDQRRAMKELLRLKNIQGLQVSTHKQFYPNYTHTMANRGKLTSIHASKVLFVADWQGNLTHLTRLGRARSLDFKPEGKPMCANFLLCGLQSHNFPEALAHLAHAGHFCTPSIDPDGTIRTGETPFCSSIGSITSSLDELYRSLRRVTLCDACGCVQNMPPEILGFMKSIAV